MTTKPVAKPATKPATKRRRRSVYPVIAPVELWSWERLMST